MTNLGYFIKINQESGYCYQFMIKKDLYSFRKRQKASRLVYDKFTSLTRQKIQYQFIDFNREFQTPDGGIGDNLWELQGLLLRCHGWDKLRIYEEGKMVPAEIRKFLLACSKDHLFDSLEIYHDLLKTDEYPTFEENINSIFSMDNIGYEYKEGKITPIISEYLHEKVIAPALSLLREAGFEGPLEEFEEAIKFFRQDRYADAIHNANNAFESTLKTVLDKKEGDPKDLINELIRKDIVEPYYEGHLDYLRKLLLCLPITRHKKGAHGQGKDKKEIGKSYAEFALHLAGTFIVFLIKRYNETLPPF